MTARAERISFSLRPSLRLHPYRGPGQATSEVRLNSMYAHRQGPTGDDDATMQATERSN
jgi:hypothetical protein